MNYSLNKLYGSIGITKQGVWDHFRREQAELELIQRVINHVDQRREEHPGEGLEKLYWQLRPEGIGRDKFCAVMSQLGYSVRREKNPVRTTIPAHKVFANLIEGRVVSGPNQVWQSDITYIKVGERFYYLTFIMDVYTRRILGYAVSKNLRKQANLQALKMALSKANKDKLNGCIHHSDRGSQYTAGDYLKILRAHHMHISMGGKAQDNAFAERINGIIKNEYLIPWQVGSFRQLKTRTRKAVADYNTKRPHRSLDRCSPLQYESSYRQLPEARQKLEVIRSDNTPDCLKASLYGKHIDTAWQYPYCLLHLN